MKTDGNGSVIALITAIFMAKALLVIIIVAMAFAAMVI